MTSNHRPTLESKKGKVLSINDSIAHSRALPLQTKLKTRTDGRKNIDYYAAARSLREEIPTGSDHQVPKASLPSPKGSVSINANVSTTKDDVSKIPADEVEQDIPQNDKVEAKDDKSDDDESENDDDSDSDETEQLMAELARIKQEREEQKQKKLQEEQLQAEQTMQKNPLLAPSKVKKSWRSTKRFNNPRQLSLTDEEKFTSSTVNSELHQSFLNKYIR